MPILAYWFPMWFRPEKPHFPGFRASWVKRLWFRYRSLSFHRRHTRWYRKVYLRSYHWRKRVRPAVLRRDRYTCQAKGCREKGTYLDVHHKKYWHLGHELERPEYLATVVTLCRRHHTMEHGEAGVEYRKRPSWSWAILRQ